MISLTLADSSIRNVLSGTVTLPRSGRWLADLVVIGDAPISGTVTANLGNVAMPARVVRAPVIDRTVHVRILGGTGDLAIDAQVKHYSNPQVRDVLGDLARTAGQTISGEVASSILSAQLEAWDTLAAPTGALLSALCAAIGDDVVWRVLFDGTLWMGRETWPVSPLDFRSLSEDGANAAELIGSSLPSLWPGTLLGGRKVDTVIHTITEDEEELRTTVLYQQTDAAGGLDRAKQSWQDMRDVQDPMWRYNMLYRAKVVAQSGDADKVDVKPQNPDLPPMAGVPLRHGIPGLRVQVATGSWLRVGWDEGRPDKPFAALWDSSSVLRMSLAATDLRLGSRDASEALMLGNTTAVELATLVTAIGSGFTSLGQTAAASACTTFVGKLPTLLSQQVRTI